MTLDVDLAPTRLGRAGVPAPEVMRGTSLGGWLRGATPARWRTEWFYEHHFGAGGWIPPTEGIRTERWKYTVYPEEQPAFEELYDLKNDPLEERNLAREAAHAAVLGQLRARRETWIQSLEKTARPPA